MLLRETAILYIKYAHRSDAIPHFYTDDINVIFSLMF